MQQIDLLIHSAAQAATCAAPDGPKRGAALADAGLIHNAALAIHDGRIVEVGDSDALRRAIQPGRASTPAARRLCPGLVDCTRTRSMAATVHEFELRIQGASYMEIMAAGGGIVSTMRHTRCLGGGAGRVRDPTARRHAGARLYDGGDQDGLRPGHSRRVEDAARDRAARAHACLRYRPHLSRRACRAARIRRRCRGLLPAGDRGDVARGGGVAAVVRLCGDGRALLHRRLL